CGLPGVLRCYEDVKRGRYWYLPPYPAELFNYKNDRRNIRLVPISEVYDGPKILQQWQQLAWSGEPFECYGLDCKLVVEGIGKNNSETYYAVCDVNKVKTIVGAPHRWCDQIAIVTKEKAWMRAVTYSPPATFRFSAGRPDFTFHIHGVPPEY